MSTDRALPRRTIFGARRPTALVVPLALVTETAGVACLLTGATIGWFICFAPLAALLLTGAVVRPTLELTREGILQRQYPFSSLTRWETIDHVAITRAGNRVILAYRLLPGNPPPRRQPAARLLRAADRPYDGGYFADCLAATPEEIFTTVARYVTEPTLRAALPASVRQSRQ